MQISVNDALCYALQHHAAGRLDDAAALYEAILRVVPQQAQVKALQHQLALQKGLQASVRASREQCEPFYLPNQTCQVRGLGALLEHHLGRKTDGRFVEVGAFDGATTSNTEFLADLGWSGLYIEPVPEYARLCLKRHRHSIGIEVAQYAVGSTEQDIEIFVAGVLTTAAPTVRDMYATIDWAKTLHAQGKTITVPQRRLETLLETYQVPPGFDLLVIDVEGRELDVMHSFDLTHWKPKMAIAELSDDHPDLKSDDVTSAGSRKVREIFSAAGYREVYRDTINTVFVRG